MLRRVPLVRKDVSEELSASIIRVTRIGELGTTAKFPRRRHSSDIEKLNKAQENPWLLKSASELYRFSNPCCSANFNINFCV
jgi:hypothetical protein